MSTSTTYFSNGAAADSSASASLTYWNNQNYHSFYNHYNYHSNGSYPHQQYAFQQIHNSIPDNSVTLPDTNSKKNISFTSVEPAINSNPLPDLNLQISNQQELRKMTPSPNTQQRMSLVIDEYLNSRFCAVPSETYNNYPITHERKSPNSTPVTIKTELLSEKEDKVSQIQSPINEKQSSTILGSILNRPPSVRINSPPNNEQEKCYKNFYNAAYETRDRSEKTEEDKGMGLQKYEVEQRSKSATSDTEGVTCQNFGVSQPERQIGFPGGGYRSPRTNLDCMQPVLQYSGQDGGKQKLQHQFYPWMKSITGESTQGPKRTRQTYTRYQTLELEKEFHFNRYLTRRRRIEIAHAPFCLDGSDRSRSGSQNRAHERRKKGR
ncbi:hypothetical protein L9F63_001608, partial [Diploptera punctata]